MSDAREGERVKLTVTFYDIAGAPVAATGVALHYAVVNGGRRTLVTPNPGDFANPTTGVYSYSWKCSKGANHWTWTGTVGAETCVSKGVFHAT